MKYCKRCKTNYSDSKNFCETCGGKLTQLVEKVEKPKVSKIQKPTKSKLLNWKFIIAIGIVIAIVICLVIYSTGFVKTNGGSAIPENKCYTVQEPYTVQVPYTYSYKYSVIDHTLTTDWNIQLGEFTRAKITLANSEDNGGSFTITYSFITSDGTTKYSNTLYISAHSTQVFEFTFDNKIGQAVTGSYEVIPQTETRYTEEVRYRNVEKCE